MVTARRMSEVKTTELAHQLDEARAREVAVAAELAAREMERSAAMEEAAAAKRTKYPKDMLKEGIRFMPFAIDDFGHIGDAGWAVLGQLAAHAAANTAGGRLDFRLG